MHRCLGCSFIRKNKKTLKQVGKKEEQLSSQALFLFSSFLACLKKDLIKKISYLKQVKRCRFQTLINRIGEATLLMCIYLKNIYIVVNGCKEWGNVRVCIIDVLKW